MKILFFGDSITDMNRLRSAGLPYSLGVGHVNVIANRLLTKNADIEIINRGNGGDKITNMMARLNEDVIDLKPDIVTILVGTNDVWHKITHHSGTPYQKWSSLYKEMIETIQKKLPKCKIFICEPFFIHGEATDYCYKEFSRVFKYARKAKKIAKEYNLVFIPLQKKLNKMADKVGNSNVLFDGVHPNVIGADVIAKAWLGAYKKYETK